MSICFRSIMTAVFLVLVAGATSAGTSQPAVAQTPYGNCGGKAQDYQERYERSGAVSDLVCMQKALERELTGGSPGYSCNRSAQSYQTAYEKDGRSSDLVCMQKALERELSRF